MGNDDKWLVKKTDDDLVQDDAPQEQKKDDLIVPEQNDIIDISCGYGKAKFGDLAKYTDKVRLTQTKIDKELECDETGGLLQFKHWLWKETKKAVGVKVHTLEELFEKEKEEVHSVRDFLADLSGVCNSHYNDLEELQLENNTLLKEYVEQRPGFLKVRDEKRREYLILNTQLKRISESDPKFYAIRERVWQLKKELTIAHGAAENNAGVYVDINQLVKCLEPVMQVILFGRKNLHGLHMKYGTAERYLAKGRESVYLARNIMKNAEVLYNANRIVSKSIFEAERLESRLMGNRLRDVTRGLPEPQTRVVKALDDLNDMYRQNGIKYLKK